MLYGSVSIAQILYQDKNHDTIPMGIIRDYPQYVLIHLTYQEHN